MFKKRNIIAKVLLAVMVISYLIPTVTSVSYALEDENKESIEKLELNEDKAEKDEVNNEENFIKKENLETKTKELEEVDGSDTDVEPDNTNVININLGNDENKSFKIHEISKGLHEFKENTTLEELLIQSYDGLKNYTKNLEEISNSIGKYKIKSIEIIKINKDEINLTPDSVNKNIIDIDELKNLYEVKNSEYYFKFEEIESINLNYEKTHDKKKHLVTINFIDPYHFKDINSNEYLNVSSTTKKIEWYRDINSDDNLIIKLDKGKNEIDLIYPDNKEESFLFVPSGYILDEEKLGYPLNEGNNNIEIELKPEEIKEYGKVILYNKFNVEKFEYKYYNIEEKLFIGTENNKFDVDEYIDFTPKNRSNKEEYKLDDRKFYKNDLLDFQFKADANKEEDIIKDLKDTNINIRSNKDEFVRLILDSDKYQYIGEDFYKQENPKSEKRDIIYFDFNRKNIEIEHIGNNDSDKELIELMPDTKYLYISPQGDNIIEVLSDNKKITEEIEIDDIKYYKIPIDNDNIDKKQKISLKYEGEKPNSIELMEYGVTSKLIKPDGKEHIMNGMREFKAYKGSIFTTQPILSHGISLDNTNVNHAGKILADYKYKMIKVPKNDNDKIEIIGYFNEKEKQILDNSFEKNIFNEKVNGKSINFTFIDKDYILYRVIHRTSYNGGQGGNMYDLELTGEDVKENILMKTKYYIIPRNKKINIKPLELEDENWKNYELIESLNINDEKIESPIIFRDEKGKDIYLNEEINHTLKDLNIESNKVDFIYSYKLKYEKIAEPKLVNLDLNIKFLDESGSQTKNKNIKLSFPKLKEDSIIEIPVSIFKETYGCYDFDNIKNILLNNGGIKEIELSTNKEVIKIYIDKYNIVEDNFFPTKSSLKSRSLNTNEEDINSLTVELVKNKDYNCKPNDLETFNINLKMRYKNNKEDTEYITEDLYILTFIKGLELKLPDATGDVIDKTDGSKVLKYIPYDSNNINTGITDSSGEHILINENIIDLGSKLTLKGEGDKLDLYLNYEFKDSDKLVEQQEQPAEYKYLKQLYYIPYEYFIKDVKDELADNIFLDYLENNTDYSKKHPVIETQSDYFINKLNFVEKTIKDYYENNLDKLEILVMKNNLNSNLLDLFKNSENDKNIKGYLEFLETIKSENLEEISISSEDIENEKEKVNKLLEIDLITYLTEYNNISIKPQLPDDIKGETIRFPDKKEVISWENPYNKEFYNDLKNKPLKNNENREYQKVYTDLAEYIKYTRTIKYDTSYSPVPLSISDNVMDLSYMDKFLKGEIEDLNIDKSIGNVTIEGVENQEVVIPIIYLEKQNWRIKEGPEYLEKPNQQTNLKLNYFIVENKGNENDIVYEIVKSTEEFKNPFYSYEFKNIPEYMVGRKFPWRIPEISNYKYIPESIVYNDENLENINNKENDIKISDVIVKDKTVEMNLYYEALEDAEYPNIETSSIKVIGYDIDKDINDPARFLYSRDITGIVGHKRYIYPDDYESKGYYLLEKGESGEYDKIVDKGNYEPIEIIFPDKDSKDVYYFYYKKIEKPNKQLKEIEIQYLDDNENPIRSNSISRLEVPKENISNINLQAKYVQGYKEKIKSQLFTLNSKSEFDLLDTDDDLKLKGLEVIKLHDKKILQKINNKDKVLEFSDINNKAIVKFYYDEITIPQPTPNPDPDWPVNPERPEVENKIKFTYDANGGLVDEKENIRILLDRGTKVKDDKVAYRDGYIFKGWSKVKDEEELFDFTKPINKDTTVYAIWGKDKDKLDKVNHFEYIQGYPDRSVRPEENITREEVSAVFYRLLTEDYKQSIYSLENNFTDLSSKRWSNKHISTLANGGILNGYEDGEFKYESFITRAEVATIASRFENLDESKHNFTDVKGHWAEEYIASASKKGWVEGYKDGSFRPDEYITRAEFVTLVNRVLNRGVKKENILEGIKEFNDLKDNTWYYEEFVEAINGHIFDRNNDKDRTSEKWLELKEFNMDM